MGPEQGVPAELGLWLVVAAVPLVLAACTAFTKASVVLAALRVGLGAETLLPWAAMLALALVVTAVIMAPTGLETWSAVETAGGPQALVEAGALAWLEALAPLREFLERHASEAEIEFFASLQGRDPSHPLVLVPAFLVTELSEALRMAVLLLVPFVVVDLVVAQALALLGITNQPATPIALPAKVLLFLGAGGWDVVVGGLVEGYLA